jgi:hypothetical protein
MRVQHRGDFRLEQIVDGQSDHLLTAHTVELQRRRIGLLIREFAVFGHGENNMALRRMFKERLDERLLVLQLRGAFPRLRRQQVVTATQ